MTQYAYWVIILGGGTQYTGVAFYVTNQHGAGLGLREFIMGFRVKDPKRYPRIKYLNPKP